jgi:predicted dehydrogenase
MDAGCYTVHLLRHLAQAEPEVVGAQARWTRGGVDRETTADLRFADGRTARLSCALLSPVLLWMGATVVGSAGRLSVVNPIAPQFWHRLTIETPTLRRAERVRDGASYDHQLRAFVAAVREGAAYPTTPADAVANMRVIEAIYAAAGRPPRQARG